MKKNLLIELILVIILIIITTITLYKKNDYNEITQGAYVSSMGIEYNLETKEYTVFLYILNNFNLGISEYATSESKNLGYTLKGSGLSLSSALQQIKNATNIRLETSHIKSMVLKDTFFNDFNVYQLIDFVKNSPNFYPSFILYVTSDKLEDIYKVNNFSETSAYYTLLINTLGINKTAYITFTNFINDCLDDNYTTYYPIIKVEKNILKESNEENITLIIDGFAFITNKTQISFFKYSNLPGLLFLNPLKKQVLSYNDIDFLVYEYYYNDYIKNNTIIIDIKLRGKFILKNNINNKTILQDILKDEIIKDLTNLFYTLYSYNIDYLNILHKSPRNSLNIKDLTVKYNIKII